MRRTRRAVLPSSSRVDSDEDISATPAPSFASRNIANFSNNLLRANEEHSNETAEEVAVEAERREVSSSRYGRRSTRTSTSNFDEAVSSPPPPRASRRPNRQDIDNADFTSANDGVDNGEAKVTVIVNRPRPQIPSANTIQVLKDKAALSDKEINSMVGSIVRYMMYMHNSQKLIRQAHLLEVLPYLPKGQIRYLMSLAKEQLQYLFGYELVALEREVDHIQASKKRKTASKSASSSSAAPSASQPSVVNMPPPLPTETFGSDSFILRNSHTAPDLIEEFNRSFPFNASHQNEKYKSIAINWLVLALVQSKENRCPESLLTITLRKYGLDVSTSPDSVLNTMVRLKYLSKSKLGDGESIAGYSDTENVFSWGARAHAETTTLDVYKGVCTHIMQVEPDEIVVNDFIRKANLLKTAAEEQQNHALPLAAAPPAARPSANAGQRQPSLSQPTARRRN